MKDALSVFRQVYKQHHSIEICIAELKREGFNQMETIKVVMEVLAISVVKADELVHDSLAWSSKIS